jgi:hypothetical protein
MSPGRRMKGVHFLNLMEYLKLLCVPNSFLPQDIYTCNSLQGEGFVALLKQTLDSIIINIIECNKI